MIRVLVHLRAFSTSNTIWRPALSDAYKSPALWQERFKCNVLGSDTELIKTINNKITSSTDLDSLELDVFINIASSSSGDVAQLQEAVSNLKKLRRSIYANTQIPSTPHALCRLFLEGDRLPSLITLLENRVDYGIFPDNFSTNMIFDRVLEQEKYVLGARLASLIMLQEEFGVDQLNDNFALYCLAKYIESKADFSDWTNQPTESDTIFSGASDSSGRSKESPNKEDNKDTKADPDEDEDEEDAEYIRIPFLRNPYNDNHFDLTNPRIICGKSFLMLGESLSRVAAEPSIGLKCQLVGHVLSGHWSEAQEILSNHKKHNLAISESLKDVLSYYMDEYHDLPTVPDQKKKELLLNSLKQVPTDEHSLSDEADKRHKRLAVQEERDIEQLRCDMIEWSKMRNHVKRGKAELEERKLLIEEIRAKKKELEEKEQFLYFYDNLKKKSLSRIVYE